MQGAVEELRTLSEGDVAAAWALEVAGYPPEEAASLAELQYRQQEASELFLGKSWLQCILSSVTISAIPVRIQPPLDRLTVSTSTTLSGHFVDGKLIGFICGIRSLEDHLTERSMLIHEPTGTTICIHCVRVDSVWRRQGVALGLLWDYVARVVLTLPAPRRICLLSHHQLLPLYTKAGFTVLGPSSVSHGPEAWYECTIELDS